MKAVCKDENCGWLVYAANNTENNYWQIKTFNDDHSCARETKNRLATRKWLAGKLVLPPPVRPPKLPPKRKSSKQEKATPGSSFQEGTIAPAATPPATSQPTTLPPSHPMQDSKLLLDSHVK
ncbi:hypothetical protein Ahy_A03g011150 [Arachis hypogaea]|uniref:Transposase MuDR plant domain-containing protein n=1 Tax=Arachis hypogaea TaxID=3818 RepID=A0A445DPS9_ARAHY|nr:hypothetical protein Ahy_A03g011150 [Arachis hypogaea]